MNRSEQFTSPTRLRSLLLVCGLVLVCTHAGFAQSGRRGAKSPAVPTATPEEVKTGVSESGVREKLSKIPMIVGTSRNDVFTGIPFEIYDAVLQSCAHRLGEAVAIMVDPVSAGLNRSEAAARAKELKEGYVVFLNLRGDDPMGGYSNNLSAIFIEYTVFEHSTAKVKTSGNSYQGTYRQGGVVLGTPTGATNRIAIEGRLRDAAEDAAVRILKALHIVSASDVPPHE